MDLPPSVEQRPTPGLDVNSANPAGERPQRPQKDKVEAMAAGTSQLDIAQSQPYTNPLLGQGQAAIGVTTAQTPAGPSTVPTTVQPAGGAPAPTPAPTAPTPSPAQPAPYTYPPLVPVSVVDPSKTEKVTVSLPPSADYRRWGDGLDERWVQAVNEYERNRLGPRLIIHNKQALTEDDVKKYIAEVQPMLEKMVQRLQAYGFFDDRTAPLPQGRMSIKQILIPDSVQYQKGGTVQSYNAIVPSDSRDSPNTKQYVTSFNNDLKTAENVRTVAAYARLSTDMDDIITSRANDLYREQTTHPSTAPVTPATPPDSSTAPVVPSNDAVSLVTGPDVQAGQDASQIPVHDSANPTLRTQYEEAEPSDIIPSAEEQLMGDIIFDTFNEVPPGFGLGTNNKLFVENEQRERKLRQVDNFFPRPDQGAPTGVLPPPWQLQEVLPVSLVQAFFSKVEDRIAAMEHSIASAMKVGNTVHALPAEVKAQPSSQGLPRQASVLTPVISNIQRWLPTVDPAGVFLNKRGLRHLHSPWNYPFEAEQDTVNSGPTLRRRRALAINLP